jgi:hypothetical protein
MECVSILAFITQYAKHTFPQRSVTYISTFIKGTIFRNKKLLNTGCVLWFAVQLLINISHSEKSSAGYYRKCTYILIQSACHFYQSLIKTSIFSTDFQKKFIIYHANLFGGSRGVPCRHTDRHDIVNNHLLQFCECIQKLFELTIIPDVTSFFN